MYLVQDVATGRLYALKKIRCPFGSEGVQDAMKEAEMYRTFQHENVIKVMVRPFLLVLQNLPYLLIFILTNDVKTTKET